MISRDPDLGYNLYTHGNLSGASMALDINLQLTAFHLKDVAQGICVAGFLPYTCHHILSQISTLVIPIMSLGKASSL